MRNPVRPLLWKATTFRSEVVTMSAIGEAPLSDGTQASVPQDSFSDPLSGLVTSERVDRPSADDFARVRVAGPVRSDLDRVREMVDAAMRTESGVDEVPAQPAEILVQPPISPVVPGEPPLGVLQRQRTWPVRPPQLVRQARRSKLRVPVNRASDRIRGVRPSSSSTGVIVALVLMIVFVVVAVELLASLFSSIAGILS
jgi:hypothetical protein